MLSSKLLSCPFRVPRTQHEDMQCEDMRCDSSYISVSRRAREPRPHRVSFRGSASGSKNVHFYLSNSRCCCYLRTKHTETATVVNFSWINSWEKKCNFEADLPMKHKLFLDLDEAHTMSKKWESEQKTEFLLLRKLHIPLTPLIRTAQGVLKNVCAAPSPRVLTPLVWGVARHPLFQKHLGGF